MSRSARAVACSTWREIRSPKPDQSKFTRQFTDRSVAFIERTAMKNRPLVPAVMPVVFSAAPPPGVPVEETVVKLGDLAEKLSGDGIGLAVVIAVSNSLLELFSPRGTDDFTMATANALICWAFGVWVL